MTARKSPTTPGARRRAAQPDPAAPAAPESAAAAVRRFRELVQAYFDQTFERFPTRGSDAGRHEFDAELGRNDPAAWEAQLRLIQSTLGEIEDLPANEFDAEAMLDRRAMLANLRLERALHGPWRRWATNPQWHLHAAADAVHMLVVRHPDDLTPVVPAILSRLKQMPRYLDEGAECLGRLEPLWKQLTLEAAPGVVEFLESLPPMFNGTGAPPATVRRLVAKAAEAVRDYAAHVRRLRPAPQGSFAVGEPTLTAMIQERLGLPWSAREVAAVGRRLAAQLHAEMTAEARRFHPTRPAAEIIEEAAAAWRPAGRGLLQAYTREVERMRERFIEADWMSFPKNDRLLVRPVPSFLKNQFPTAAYSSPGALDPDQTGIFWVNDPVGEDSGEALSPAGQAAQAAEVAQHFGLELTCAHEAYPGHHLQFVRQNHHPSLARKMAQHAVYYEGWTLWCEQMVIDLAIPENPYLRLIQLHDALWRAWRVVIDVGLHTGELSHEQAAAVLVREVGFTEARARGDVNWYTGAPTVPMSYLLGKMELLRLKRHRVDGGAMSLREFNDWVLSFGAIPWRWIEESGL